jgi:hypothetical protein
VQIRTLRERGKKDVERELDTKRAWKGEPRGQLWGRDVFCLGRG